MFVSHDGVAVWEHFLTTDPLYGHRQIPHKNVEFCDFPACNLNKLLNKRFEFPMIWDALNAIWRQYNV